MTGGPTQAAAAPLPVDHPVTRWYAALNAGDDAALSDVLTGDFLCHQGSMRADAALLSRMRSGLREGFPDLEVTFEPLHACGDFVTVSTLTTATHAGTFMGHEATGRSFRATGLDAFRLESGRIAELWACFDTEGMLRQLGLRGGAP